MSLRTLKHHESKLLKRVDFLRWKNDDTIREGEVMRRYGIEKREDYMRYNKIIGELQKLIHKLKALDPADPYRIKMTEMLLQKLFTMGVINTDKTLSMADNVTVSALCRRRLPVLMVRLKMAETLNEAMSYVKQGHVRVGPEIVTDPAFLVTRSLEDFITWTDSSRIRKTIMKYNDKLDDYSLLGN